MHRRNNALFFINPIISFCFLLFVFVVCCELISRNNKKKRAHKFLLKLPFILYKSLALKSKNKLTQQTNNLINKKRKVPESKEFDFLIKLCTFLYLRSEPELLKMKLLFVFFAVILALQLVSASEEAPALNKLGKIQNSTQTVYRSI